MGGLSNRLFGILVVLSKKQLLSWMDSKTYIRLMYRLSSGKKLNLEDPKLFGEKLQWLKLHDDQLQYKDLVDKYAVKDYVAGIIGQQYIIPTLGVWDKFDDIDFSGLPDRFVLKCTHDSGGLVICKDKRTLDIRDAKQKIDKCMKSNYFYVGREPPYRHVPHRIIAERYMENAQGEELADYKFYCFQGRPAYCQVISERRTSEKIDFFDMAWNHMDFTGFGSPLKPPSERPVPVPEGFDEMKKIAALLSKDIPFLRVDLYNIDGKPYFGELTFFPASGFGRFEPDQYNGLIGDMIKLPEE